MLTNWLKKRPLLEEPPEQPKSLGLHLEVRHPNQGSIELRLSEKVASLFAPWIVLVLLLSIVAAGGLWLLSKYIPHPPSTVPQTEEGKPRK